MTEKSGPQKPLTTLKRQGVDERHRFVCSTEQLIRSCEGFQPASVESSRDCTMWFLLHAYDTPRRTSLRLQPVVTEADYKNLLLLRTEVEKAFGIEDPVVIRQLVNDVQSKVKHLSGQWYLAWKQSQIVGGIGIIPFVYKGMMVGRLQDVDILPAYQGRGLGHQLLDAICREAITQEYSALCLMAQDDDWPKQWYRRYGFQTMGVALHADVTPNKLTRDRL